MKKLSKYIYFSLLITPGVVLILGSCQDKHQTANSWGLPNKKIQVINFSVDRDVYKVNDKIKLSYTFTNEGASDVMVNNIIVQVKDISNTSFPVIYEKKVGSELIINAKGKQAGNIIDLWKIPTDAEKTVCGIFLAYEVDENIIQLPYQVFFRIINDKDLATSLRKDDSQIELMSMSGLDRDILR